MKVEINGYDGGQVTITMDIHNRNGSLDACASRKLTKSLDSGWKNILSWALSYKGYTRDGDVQWVTKTDTMAVAVVPASKGASKSERKASRVNAVKSFVKAASIAPLLLTYIQ